MLMSRLVGFVLALSVLFPSGSGGAAQQNKEISLQYFGLHIHRAGAGTDWPNVPFGSWRLWDAYVGWAQLEPSKGKWDFSRLDRYVAMARQARVDVLLPLAMTPPWASARPLEPSAYHMGNASEPAELVDWARYVATVGKRYKGQIKHYEIWNEPSDRSHYSGSVENMVKLSCEAYRILKEIDPENRIVSPASAGGGRHIEYLDRFLSLGGKDCIDIVGHHFYVYKDAPEAIIPLVRSVRKVMEKNGVADFPLWNTEAGYWIENGDGTPDHPMVSKGGWRKLGILNESGDYLMRALMIARAEGVDRFYWYSWDNRYGFGMLEPTTGAAKPMVEQWRRVTEKLVGASNLRCYMPDRISWKCSFRRRNGTDMTVGWIVK